MIKFLKLKNLINYLHLDFIYKANIKLLVTLISLSFLGISIYNNAEGLSNETIGIQESIWIIVAILFSFLSIIINAYAWMYLIESLDCKKNNLSIVKIFISTNIYKYLPGGIWHFVSRFKTLRLQMSIEDSIESILLEPVLMLVSGLILIPFGSWNLSILILCWSSPLVFLIGFRELIIRILKSIKSSIFSNFKEIDQRNRTQNIKRARKLIYPYRALFVELIFILARFIGFLCCLKAFSINTLISQDILISSFSLAWVVGLVVPAAPGGLGVFESIILVGLGSRLPEAPLLASLLCYRFVSTLADVLAALIYPLRRHAFQTK